MGQLLRRRIIHHVVIGLGNGARRLAFGRKGDRQVDVIKHRPVVAQMRQQLLFARRRVAAERLERGAGDDPGADGGGGGLGLERPQRLIFPGLDVARRPVVEQHVAKDHVIGFLDRDRPVGFLADDGAHLQLEIEAGAGGKARGVVVRPLELAPGAAHIGARDHDRGGPAVIADRNVQPVRWQGVLGAAEHGADIGGVMLAGIEIGVFRDQKRHVHRGGRLLDEEGLDRGAR